MTIQGATRFAIGNPLLELSDSLLFPNYAYTITSAGKLHEKHGILAANANEVLVRMKDNRPIARSNMIDHVLYVNPLRTTNPVTVINNNKAAPGASIIPHATNAQRLGHTSQKKKEKNSQYSLDLDGINFMGLTNCDKKPYFTSLQHNILLMMTCDIEYAFLAENFY